MQRRCVIEHCVLTIVFLFCIGRSQEGPSETASGRVRLSGEGGGCPEELPSHR